MTKPAILFLLAVITAAPLYAQQEHFRIAPTETPGRRIELKTLAGAVLFTGPKFKAGKRVPLIVHFHGAPWLVQHHIANELPHAALITVQLGAGSRVYNDPFVRPEAFRALIDEARSELGLKREWSSITLSGFSAGYGAVRAILRHEENFARVNNLLLLDGIHASYLPEGATAATGGIVNAVDVDSFVKFARFSSPPTGGGVAEGRGGGRRFVITHSQIAPGTYASTTECTDYLLATLGLKRKAVGNLTVGEGSSKPIGMQLLTTVDAKGLHIRGYAGDTAPDHVDHLHAMSSWLGLLRIR